MFSFREYSGILTLLLSTYDFISLLWEIPVLSGHVYQRLVTNMLIIIVAIA